MPEATTLQNIPGIGKATVELLAAANVHDVETLAHSHTEQLTAELERANDVSKICKRPPASANVQKWIAAAQETLSASLLDPAVDLAAVNYEKIPQVMAMVGSAPLAIPFPARLLMERKIKVNDIPEAILLNHYAGDLEVKVDEKIPRPNPARAPRESKSIRQFENAAARVEIDRSKIRRTQEAPVDQAQPAAAPAGENSPNEERLALLRGPASDTNRGRNPESLFFIRGVLHSHPISLAVGAFFALLLWAWLPLAIISAALLLLSDLVQKSFAWVPKWLLMFPLALPVVAILYVIFSFGGTCRICGQKQFVPRACIKNPKAHHVWGLGYIVPVALHMLVFKWFRCTYCGTPVRLKK
jgi:Domain of unknown function (DUF4332)